MLKFNFAEYSNQKIKKTIRIGLIITELNILRVEIHHTLIYQRSQTTISMKVKNVFTFSSLAVQFNKVVTSL